MHIRLKRVAGSVIYLRIRLCSSPNINVWSKLSIKFFFFKLFLNFGARTLKNILSADEKQRGNFGFV